MKGPARIRVRRVTLGGDATLVCAPLVATTRAALLVEARAVLRNRPDVLEWRVDYFREIEDTQAVLEAGLALRKAIGDTALIFTRRSPREGGRASPLREDDVVELYKAICEARFADFVDYEMAQGAARVRRVVAAAHRRKVRVILSSHDFERTPSVRTMVARFARAGRMGADAAKLAVMPRSRLDALALLQATARAHATSRIPLIAMSMGPLGAVTRLVGGLFGSSLSFAVGAQASAPGQPRIEDLRAAFALLDRTRG